MHELKIPKDRVGCLVGKKGEIKKEIEKQMNVKLRISKEGDVEICGESVNEYNTGLIVKAIGRGFNPKIAILLSNEDYFLEVIGMTAILGRSRKKLLRIRARIIGTNGRARRHIEKITNTKIVVYGKTISIIGEFENVAVAREGIEKLLKGAPHSNAYKLITEEMKKRAM